MWIECAIIVRTGARPTPIFNWNIWRRWRRQQPNRASTLKCFDFLFNEIKQNVNMSESEYANDAEAEAYILYYYHVFRFFISYSCVSAPVPMMYMNYVPRFVSAQLRLDHLLQCEHQVELSMFYKCECLISLHAYSAYREIGRREYIMVQCTPRRLLNNRWPVYALWCRCFNL